MMNFNRRKFLKSSGLAVAASFIPLSFHTKMYHPLLSFSTLGCPDWTFQTIIDFASQHNYDGIELRGIQREMDLTKCKEFGKENIKTTLQMMKDKNLKFIDLGSSTSLHTLESADRKKSLDEGRRFIDLAQKINCPFIRVFPNSLPKEQDKDKTIDLITKGLMELGDYAKGSNVMVLMETHGDVVHSADLEKIMVVAKSEHTGLVWDIANMWTITKEPPADVYAKLKTYIHHTHIKDAVILENKIQYRLLGQGEVPIFEAIDLLVKNNYRGYFSFEWEKLWHPEIAEPEIALADYPEAMKQHFKK